MIETGSLSPQDRAAWEVLARGYKRFYRTDVPDEGYEQMWRRLSEGRDVHAVGARADGELVGIAHYLFHATGWTGDSCYLQDLYVDEAARGRGAARALIERVAGAARERGRPGCTGPPGRTTSPPAPCTTGWRPSTGSSATTTRWDRRAGTHPGAGAHPGPYATP